jgi:hypothetical protein
MDIFVGIAMLVYCIGGLAYGSLYGFDQRLMTQIGVSGVGSVLILFSYAVNWIKNFKLPQIKLPKKSEEKMNDISIDEKSVTDFKCLHYLKHRAEEIESKEMLDLVIQLNTLLFNGCCKTEKKSE